MKQKLFLVPDCDHTLISPEGLVAAFNDNGGNTCAPPFLALPGYIIIPKNAPAPTATQSDQSAISVPLKPGANEPPAFFCPGPPVFVGFAGVSASVALKPPALQTDEAAERPL